jgi:hypothetical protein
MKKKIIVFWATAQKWYDKLTCWFPGKRSKVYLSYTAMIGYCERKGYDDARAGQLIDAAIAWFACWGEGRVTDVEVEQLERALGPETLSGGAPKKKAKRRRPKK